MDFTEESNSFESVDSLVDAYSTVYKGYLAIENSELPSNTQEYQIPLRSVTIKTERFVALAVSDPQLKCEDKVTRLISFTEKLVHGVNKHNLFSQNENFDELPVEHLRFILLPALLGYFSSKQTLTTNNPDESRNVRKKAITQSQVYYKDFQRLCRLYGVKSVPPEAESDDDVDNNDDDIGSKRRKKKKAYQQDPLSRKTEKVIRFKLKKSLETQVNDLLSKMNLDHVDDSTQKEYFTTLIDQWVLNSIEELEFIEEELEILEHMSKMASMSVKPKQPEAKPGPSRPFILTKTDLQKQVFGLGYPSIPTYTLDEFYKAQVKAGQIPLPDQGGSQNVEAEAAAAEKEEIVKEYKIENDDAGELKKAREWDDWKDDHRRGWGNRKNMG